MPIREKNERKRAKLTADRRAAQAKGLVTRKRAEEKRKSAFLAALPVNRAVLVEACREVEISYDTVHRWLQNDGEFKAAVERIRQAREEEYHNATERADDAILREIAASPADAVANPNAIRHIHKRLDAHPRHRKDDAPQAVAIAGASADASAQAQAGMQIVVVPVSTERAIVDGELTPQARELRAKLGFTEEDEAAK